VYAWGMKKKKRITLQTRLAPEAFIAVLLRQDEIYQDTGIFHAQSDVIMQALTDKHPHLIADAVEIMGTLDNPTVEDIKAAIAAWEE